jgi:DNA repair protein RadC
VNAVDFGFPSRSETFAAMARPPAPSPYATEYELLFGVLVPCLGWLSAAEASEAVLRVFGDLTTVLAAPEDSLAAVNPLGEDGAAALKGLAAAARYLGALRQSELPVLRSPTAILAHLHEAGPTPAGLRAIFLDARDRAIADETVGGVGGVDAARVLRRAFALDAVSVILVRHGHEGDPVALEVEALAARRVAAACEVMEVELRDYVMVGTDAPKSLRGLGLIG